MRKALESVSRKALKESFDKSGGLLCRHLSSRGWLFCCYQSTRLVDKDVSGAEQRCKRSERNDNAPEHAGALFLDCGFKHDDSLLVSVDEAKRGLVRREFV